MVKKSGVALGDPGGGFAPGARPPNSRGPMIFFMPETLNCLNIFYILSLILIEIWSKHAKIGINLLN